MFARHDEDAAQPGLLGAANVVPEIVADHGHFPRGEAARRPVTAHRPVATGCVTAHRPVAAGPVAAHRPVATGRVQHPDRLAKERP